MNLPIVCEHVCLQHRTSLCETIGNRYHLYCRCLLKHSDVVLICGLRELNSFHNWNSSVNSRHKCEKIIRFLHFIFNFISTHYLIVHVTMLKSHYHWFTGYFGNYKCDYVGYPTVEYSHTQFILPVWHQWAWLSLFQALALEIFVEAKVWNTFYFKQ